MAGYPTRAAAEAAVLTLILAVGDPEPSTITVCVCGRTDLEDMANAARSAVMAACRRCERKIIAAGGRA
ncbi:MAG: hypothetical protein U1C74_02180 [Phenylobacterium sp.]|nr:hypothetical protein [Phenylobacterium sp.]